jgi:ABC-type phosphate transport system permease subunit
MVFGAVYGPPFVREGDVRRDGSFADYENFCRLSQSFDALDSVGGVVTEPNDLSLDSRHLDMAFAAATLTDKFFMGNVVTHENAKDVIRMAEIIHGGRAAIEQTPALISLVNCNSPLRWDDRMLDSMREYALAGQPVVTTPFLLMGAMSPVTIPATLAQQMAEALVAIAIAIPLSVFSALAITEYSTAKRRKWLIGVVDLLAAVPSLLFGLWGFLYLSNKIVPISLWLTQNLGWIPLFKTSEDASLTGSIFIAGIVVALMVLPIITSVVREVFSQTPPGEKEAALALGGTRWGMIKTVVLPFGKGGIIGGSMLGLGRALGETIAVALLLPQVPQKIGDSIHILQNGGATVSGFIANRAGADAFTTSGLLAAGLVLFIITLGTNMIASVVVSKSRSGAGVDI